MHLSGGLWVPQISDHDERHRASSRLRRHRRQGIQGPHRILPGAVLDTERGNGFLAAAQELADVLENSAEWRRPICGGLAVLGAANPRARATWGRRAYGTTPRRPSPRRGPGHGHGHGPRRAPSELVVTKPAMLDGGMARRKREKRKWPPFGVPKGIVLLATPDGWRHSVLTLEGGMLCGRLAVPVDTDPHDARAAAAAMVAGLARDFHGADVEVNRVRPWSPGRGPPASPSFPEANPAHVTPEVEGAGRARPAPVHALALLSWTGPATPASRASCSSRGGRVAWRPARATPAGSPRVFLPASFSVLPGRESVSVAARRRRSLPGQRGPWPVDPA